MIPTDRLPFVPPPAGAWIRSRLLPAVFYRSARTSPEWSGVWHLNTGDLQSWPRGDMVAARARCGHQIQLRFIRYDGCVLNDHVALDDRPTVDVCSRCVRLSGDTATADFLDTARRRPTAILPG